MARRWSASKADPRASPAAGCLRWRTPAAWPESRSSWNLGRKRRENGWLVGGISTPLKKIRVRQLGWWHSQLNGKIKVMFQTTNQMGNGWKTWEKTTLKKIQQKKPWKSWELERLGKKPWKNCRSSDDYLPDSSDSSDASGLWLPLSCFWISQWFMVNHRPVCWIPAIDYDPFSSCQYQLLSLFLDPTYPFAWTDNAQTLVHPKKKRWWYRSEASTVHKARSFPSSINVALEIHGHFLKWLSQNHPMPLIFNGKTHGLGHPNLPDEVYIFCILYIS